jgi:hypothetical protein
MSEFYEVIASSDYGGREAIYELVEGVLVLRDQGNHDNLSGNDQVCDFAGLTIPQAEKKIEAIMSEPVGHAYDGCHACTWSISIRKCDPPAYLTYEHPAEASVIRAALEKFRERNK